VEWVGSEWDRADVRMIQMRARRLQVASSSVRVLSTPHLAQEMVMSTGTRSVMLNSMSSMTRSTARRRGEQARLRRNSPRRIHIRRGRA
jgi:hypothetical protein